jgi:hAT family C-terminal dimerisation region
VWTSLARDYLSIMASSVSSERAFSQGGITITKRRSRLKGDIVEALQCVKCSLRNDLLFREPGPSSLAEVEPDDFEIEVDAEKAATDEDEDEEGWDALFLEEDDDNLQLDIDMDEV